MIPRATYRLQFNHDFTFADAAAIVPYLAKLGISHVYASPITRARTGSKHGYDVVDPTQIDPLLGGRQGLEIFSGLLRENGMGIILDIVPNHMGIAGGENHWWNDVLTHGRDSAFADFFDIDWHRPIMLPILGTTLSQATEAGAIEVIREGDSLKIVAYGEHRLPVRPEDTVVPQDDNALRALLDRQHYRLASWRTANDLLNWRRFFTINELAGLRVEDPKVFEATHALVFALYAEGVIDGVRIDHVDGLTDPAAYCRKLRQRLDSINRPDGDRAYIVVEKILGPGETLAQDWGVDGTSGYDFMEQVAALLHDPQGEAPLTEAWARLSGRPAAFATEELLARQQLLDWQFAGQLDACVDAFVALAVRRNDADATTPAMLRRAIERLLWVFPVYRTYGTGAEAPASDATIREQVRAAVSPHVPPGEAYVVDLILAYLAGEGGQEAATAVRRFQQLSAPIAAKSVEDTAFYRYGRLLSRNDVGFDSAHWSSSLELFAQEMETRAAEWPHAMLATATHDHKRGEDVRARLAVLSEVPDLWLAEVARWDAAARALVDGVDPADRYMLWQTLVGSWPEHRDNGYAERIRQWQQKALREAKLRSSWEAPDDAYEARCARLVDLVLGSAAGSPIGKAIAAFVDQIAPAASANTLAQTILRYTVPGVPDLYQGTELADLSLVDPDNRRAVDYAERGRLLESGGDEKLSMIARLLAARKHDPDLFAAGNFRLGSATGPLASHVLAVSRSYEDRFIDVAVILHSASLTLARGDDDRASLCRATMLRFDGGVECTAEMLVNTPGWFSVRQRPV